MSKIQIFIVMFLSRIFITLLYMPKSGKTLRGGDLIIQMVFAILILLVCAIPIYLLLNDKKQRGLLRRTEEVGKPFSIACRLIIIAIMVFISITSLIRFNIFATTVIFPKSDLRVFLGFIILCAIYASVMGLSVIGRTAEIFFTLIVFSIVFVLISTVDRFELTNFTPILYDGVKGPLIWSFFTVSSSIELFYPLFFEDKIDGSFGKLLYPWLLLTMIFLLSMVVWQAGILGDYANTQVFPFFSLTSLSTLGFIERLDAFITSSWVICIFLRLTIYITICKECLKGFSRKLNDKISISIISVVLVICVMLIRESYQSRLFLENMLGPLISFVLLVVLIPSILVIHNRKEVST